MVGDWEHGSGKDSWNKVVKEEDRAAGRGEEDQFSRGVLGRQDWRRKGKTGREMVEDQPIRTGQTTEVKDTPSYGYPHHV
ncbi:hypothetical protein BDZ91DRAFT_741385 [Kalaharituber pfeilii]|nr:hypothetical protein BDZ91DRAFT_741385 [Kalaharituber pfeilii]